MEAFQADALVLRRNIVLPAVCGAIAVAAVVVASTSFAYGPWAWFTAILTTLFGGLVLLRNAFPLGTAVSVRATGDTVTIGAAEIPAASIVEAKLVPHTVSAEKNTRVELVLRDRRTARLLLSRGDAAALLARIGERRRSFLLSIRFAKRFLAMLLLVGVPWFALLAPTTPDPIMAAFLLPLGIVPFCAFLAWAVLGLLRFHLVIGADGFTMRRLGRDVFVPFRDVERIESRTTWSGDAFTRVERRGAPPIALHAFERPNTDAERGAERRALFAHLSDAFQKSEALRGDAQNALALLGRGKRSAREWLASLDGLAGGGQARYRVAAVSTDSLAAIVRDASGATDARAGAAAALVRSGEEGSRALVRVAADACAEPALRTALLELAEAEGDDAVEKALARLA